MTSTRALAAVVAVMLATALGPAMPEGWPAWALAAATAALAVALDRALAQAAGARPAAAAGLADGLAQLAERTGHLVVLSDAQRRVVWVNEAFTRASGWELHEIAGRDAAALLRCERTDAAESERVAHAQAQGQAVRAELLNRSRDGREFRVALDIQPLHDHASGALSGYLSVAAVIADPVQPLPCPPGPAASPSAGEVPQGPDGDAIEAPATTRARPDGQPGRPHRAAIDRPWFDELTRLPGRRAVLERLARSIEHRRRHPLYGFAVLCIDVDHFRPIGQRLGRPAADELLRQLAARLVDVLRPGDAVARLGPQEPGAARAGGDEFVVVLEGLREDPDLLTVAERVRCELGQPCTVNAQPLPASVSIGALSGWSAVEAGDAEAALRDAEIAMLEAKRAGRDCVVAFEPAMRERAIGHQAVENDLRVALERDELFVVYQPMVHLSTGQLAGMEALLRWRHPERGVVLPGQFIGVAEACGLIDVIGERVLHQACRQFREWRRLLGADAPGLVAVNLSRVQLARPGFVAEVRQQLEACEMRPAQLQLEITEVLADGEEGPLSTLRELRTLGVGLALDDFGTGGVSLGGLHRLPVDTVKIAPGFVAQGAGQEHHRVLIEATVKVARTLGMTTVAEGIETEEQAAVMTTLRCDRGQGGYCGRPMPADEVPAYVTGLKADTVT